jgi:hypothetical protein
MTSDYRIFLTGVASHTLEDGEEKEEVWDPTKICGHPDCGLQVCSDRLVSEFFCCGKCLGGI